MEKPEWKSLFTQDEYEVAIIKYGEDLRSRTKNLFDGDDCVKIRDNFKANIEKAGFKIVGLKFNDDKVEALFCPETEMV